MAETSPEVMMLDDQRPAAMAQLERDYRLLRWDLADDKAAFLAEHGAEVRVAVTGGGVPLTREMLEAMPKLELVATSSAGYDGYDTQAMIERGVRLANSSPALCDDVADTAILLMLAARRGLVAADAYVRSGEWGRKGPFPLQRTLRGKRAGIVGMGTIGKAIARRCVAMEMDVAYWNRRPKDVPWPHVTDPVELARESEILIVAVAGGPETRHLVSAEVLEALGPDGLLVNISRGSTVDEAALIALLRDGRLGTAGLDVYENEPTPDPALTSLPNVTLLPHHASATVETRDAMAQLVVDNLGAFFAGRPLLSPVDLQPPG